MKINVEISQNQYVGEHQYVPALIGLTIANPTGAKGPHAYLRPEVVTFIDLTAKQARELAQELLRNVEKVEKGEVRDG